MATTTTAGQAPAHKENVFRRLYTGTGAFDIVGKRKRFYIFFGVIVLVCLVSIIVRGFTFSIEFEGGTQISLPAQSAHGTISVAQATQSYVDALGKQPDTVQSVGTGSAQTLQIRSDTLTEDQVSKLETTMFNELQPLDNTGKPSQQAISDSAVSSSWGSQISRQALIGLIIFLVLVTVFLSIYFERWMALAALIALANDLIVTAGVYSIVGFQVSPSTVIGLLTILGFSLYDAVVVFDKVRENSRGILGLTRRTFAEEANLALNQTLMRSINTSLIALLPVLGLLVVGIGVLGVGTLTDLALVQLVGLLIGAASSLCLATPLLVEFKMRQPAYIQQAKRVQNRRDTLRAKEREQQARADELAAQVQEQMRLIEQHPENWDLSDDPAVRTEQIKFLATTEVYGTGGDEPAFAQASRNVTPRVGQRPNRPSGGKGGRPTGKRKR